MGLAGRVRSLHAVPYTVGFPWAVFCWCSPVFGVSGCEFVTLLRALCLACFVGSPSSSPPNGRLVLLLDVLGRGGPWGSVSVVQVALGRHGRAGCVRCMARPHGGACCGGAWPPSWWGVIWLCVAPPMVGRAVVVPSPPRGGVCYGGAWPAKWWGELWWCFAPLMVGRAVLVRGPPPSGACSVAAAPSM